MADFANMNVSTDNEVSIYDTPDTTLVIDGSFDDSLNMNTSLIQAEQGKESSSFSLKKIPGIFLFLSLYIFV